MLITDNRVFGIRILERFVHEVESMGDNSVITHFPAYNTNYLKGTIVIFFL